MEVYLLEREQHGNTSCIATTDSKGAHLQTQCQNSRVNFLTHTLHSVSLRGICVEMAKQTDLFVSLSLWLLLLSHGNDSSRTRFAAHRQVSDLRLTLLVLCLALSRTTLLCCLSTFLCITTFGALGRCLWCCSCLA